MVSLILPMADVVEGTLTFSFPDDWQVIKFDETLWYTERMKRSLKGMDILAAKENSHWWIEIKDCVGYEPDNLPRMSETLPVSVVTAKQWLDAQAFAAQVKVQRRKLFIIDEVMQKFRDTLVSVVVAHREIDGELSSYTAPARSGQGLVIVLLLTWSARDYGRLAARLKMKLDMALKPYGLTGFVVDETCRVPGLDLIVSRAV
ncbi:hypothetical protein ALQ65_100555 [Pseudomonas syringae pv. coriandricola]|uniref:Uncharacterized protein n=2 Tax=Pseudomonas TaxID=286 RepID=A0A0P9N2Z0_9PSED|nr:hypothetical protein ALO76_100581 [Pseudomonas syringae pv. coriandricola]RMN13336.1 hypothetical protein ALQ65_100555 [Pseudomonas syringae pv. coriandricola]